MDNYTMKANKKQEMNYRQHTMTVQELYEKLGEIIKKGDGDAMIEVSDNCGGGYSLSKDTLITINNTDIGKWCSFE